VLPLARGGREEDANRATTSMRNNALKSSWTLEELGWRLRLEEECDRWDGLTGWFADHIQRHPHVLNGDRYLTCWARALRDLRQSD